MSKAGIEKALQLIRKKGRCRKERAVASAMGSKTVFEAYDFGYDTAVFERGAWKRHGESLSVLVAEKRDLSVRPRRGHVITVTGGNHSVAAIPLLYGRLWDLCNLPAERRSEVLGKCVATGNIVDGTLELSQRDVPCDKLLALDGWLVERLGIPLSGVIMAERNDETLQRLRLRGLEWRVKPLAWSDAGMRDALASSRKRISSEIEYYHSAKGVHFLTWSGFHKLASLARSDFRTFRKGLAELAGTFEPGGLPMTLIPKFHGHHEIEFFGLMDGCAEEKLVPKLVELLGDIESEPDRAPGRIAEIDARFKALLTRPEYADESSKEFVDAMYMHLTGEIYAVSGGASATAFDARRTALPGATFVKGEPEYHPGADSRTKTLLSNERRLLKNGEFVEYANIYELRAGIQGDGAGREAGLGRTREISFKTNCRPIPVSFIEKKLSNRETGYGAYVLARIECFKALGISLPEYRLLTHHSTNGPRSREYDYYIRTRCEGESIGGLPANIVSNAAVQEKIAFLMGDAAAQNLAMKKYDKSAGSALFGAGKEIYRFAWDAASDSLLPDSVSTCSVRGSCGWPDCSLSEKNFRAAAKFYMREYAAAFRAFTRSRNVPPARRTVLCEKFLAGFEFRTRALAFRFKRHREEIERFNPPIPARYGLGRKMAFATASLAWQAENLDSARDLFIRFANRREQC